MGTWKLKWATHKAVDISRAHLCMCSSMCAIITETSTSVSQVVCWVKIGVQRGLELTFSKTTLWALCYLVFQISQSLCLHWWCAWLGWSLTDVYRKQKVLPKRHASAHILTSGWVSSIMLFGADRTDRKSNRCTYLSVHRKCFRVRSLGLSMQGSWRSNCFLKVIQSQLNRLFDKHKRIASSAQFRVQGCNHSHNCCVHVTKLGILHTCEQFCKTNIRCALMSDRGYLLIQAFFLLGICLWSKSFETSGVHNYFWFINQKSYAGVDCGSWCLVTTACLGEHTFTGSESSNCPRISMVLAGKSDTNPQCTQCLHDHLPSVHHAVSACSLWQLHVVQWHMHTCCLFDCCSCLLRFCVSVLLQVLLVEDST